MCCVKQSSGWNVSIIMSFSLAHHLPLPPAVSSKQILTLRGKGWGRGGLLKFCTSEVAPVRAAVGQTAASTSVHLETASPGSGKDLTVARAAQEREIQTKNAAFSFVGWEGL